MAVQAVKNYWMVRKPIGSEKNQIFAGNFNLKCIILYPPRYPKGSLSIKASSVYPHRILLLSLNRTCTRSPVACILLRFIVPAIRTFSTPRIVVRPVTHCHTVDMPIPFRAFSRVCLVNQTHAVSQRISPRWFSAREKPKGIKFLSVPKSTDKIGIVGGLVVTLFGETSGSVLENSKNSSLRPFISNAIVCQWFYFFKPHNFLASSLIKIWQRGRQFC